MSGTERAARWAQVGKAVSVSLLLAGVAACTTTGDNDKAEINTKTKFAEADYGVPASPRVTAKKTVRVGGGRYQVGKPYEVAGKWYHPKLNADYEKSGLASWYGPNFHGRLTANGEVYNQYALTAANPTLPLPCYARVTNKNTGDSVIVRVNDRGPFAPGRIIDVSSEAARLLHMRSAGIADVDVKFVGLAPLDGDDASYLMASYRPGVDGAAPVGTDTGETGVMLAMNDTPPAAVGGLPGVQLAGAVPVERPVEPMNTVSPIAPQPQEVPVAANAMMPVTEAVSPAQQGIQAALLPRVGPIPSIRPTLAATSRPARVRRSPEVTAYASGSSSESADPFDDVLSERQLTPQAIVNAWNHRLVASN